MPSPIPDADLRRMVADLAALHADDIAGILDALGAAERPLIENLLREYTGSFGIAPPQVNAGYDISRFSPWLIQRLETVGIFEGGFKMTAHALEMLRDCAESLAPVSPARAVPGRRAP